MEIILLIKQVPDSTRVKVDPVTGTLIRAGVPSILNPYDHFALQQALKIKKEHNANLTILSMGPPQAEEVIKMALALGADRGILLTDRAFAGSDTWATSYTLAQAIRKIGKFDLILAGMMAIDGDTAQTGPGVAQQLRLPQITFCDELTVDKKKLTAKKIIEGGHEVVECQMPVLCTMIMPHDFIPPYPSFVNIYKAHIEKPVEIWTVKDIEVETKLLGLEGSPTRVDKIFPPKQREKGEIFKGSPAEMVEKLLQILEKEEVI
jgi:electron transfer flavoprotein beta subunit